MARFRPRRDIATSHRTTGPELRAPHAGYRTGAEVWLVRHGQVHEDWQGVAYGDLDVPLSEQGRAETARLVERFVPLRPDAVLSSPLQRALVLGEALAAATGAPLRVESDLREVHRGSWQGRRVAELHELDPDSVEAFYEDPWSWRGHGGESDALVLKRAWRVLERELTVADGLGEGRLAAAPARRIVFTTHYNVIRNLAAHALGIPAPSSFAFRIDPGAAALLVDRAEEPGGWVLRHSNVGGPSPVRAARETDDSSRAKAPG